MGGATKITGEDGQDGSNGSDAQLYTGFEEGELLFGNTDPNITYITNDVRSGKRAAEILGTGNNALFIPEDLVNKFIGERLELSFWAKLTTYNPDSSEVIRTAWYTGGNIEYKEHVVTHEWEKFTHIMENTPDNGQAARITFNKAKDNTNNGWLLDNVALYLKEAPQIKYTWIKYADSLSGTGMSDIPVRQDSYWYCI